MATDGDDAGSGGSAGQSVRVLIAALVGLFLLLAAGVALYAFGSEADRARLLSFLVPALGAGFVAGIPAVFTFIRGEQTRAVVHRIDRQTNGVLDQRIRNGVRAGLVEHYAQTAIPAQRVDTREETPAL